MEFENLKTLLDWFNTFAQEIIKAVNQAVGYFKEKFDGVFEEEE